MHRAQVTEEQECSPQVFLSAVQYLDRVLACLPIKRFVSFCKFVSVTMFLAKRVQCVCLCCVVGTFPTTVFNVSLSLIRTQLQLLASACLLLASKLHDPRPMSLLNLVVFTDCSISVPELQSMEMLVLEKLRYIQIKL